MVDTSTAEAGLCNHETFTAVPEQILFWYANVLVSDVSVMTFGLHTHRHITNDIHTRGVLRHDDHRVTLVARRIGISDDHDD